MNENIDEKTSNNIPNHIAIIMDGNGRWAKKFALPISAGHNKGAQTLRKITDDAMEIGVRELTVYAFSTENWNRDKQEVDALMDLMDKYLDTYTKDAKVKDVIVNIIGDYSKLRVGLIKKIENIIEITKDKKSFKLNIAINYGGRDEIVRATKKIIKDIKSGNLQEDELTEKSFENYLDAKENFPDLLIRTGGEIRISNFLLWQIAYSEMYFTDKLWPDFTRSDLISAIDFYKNRERRFGKRNK